MAVKVERRGLSGDWMLDSGASSHVCVEKEPFTSFKKFNEAFQVWDGEITRGNMCGSVVIEAMNSLNQSEMTLVLDKVEFSPSGPANLLRLGLMLNEGWELSASPPSMLPKKAYLTRDGKQLAFIHHGTHFWLNTGNFGDTCPGVMAAVNADASPLMKCHEPLAHLNEAALKFMVKNGVVQGMGIPAEQLKTKLNCHSCMKAKQWRMTYSDASD
ncbi:hypothetical protein PI124_g15218 [Phytophthora idaei]|nr:hypothetical protein PI125_g19593 [Phytophthora idaei]KAG3136765.1 hypothetical protein PI126_g17671 [Phytophthora idaei]KAG3239852.1 hypothetical protein PI124_g15218 [Phytophthora idaei]